MNKIIAIIGFTVLVAMPIGVYGKEGTDNTSDVVISFELTAEDRFPYEVRVSEGGCLYDGSQKITDGIMEYELSVGETKEFSLEANRGYEIKEIRTNEGRLNTDIEKIRITGISARSVLEVRYGKKEETVMPEPDIPDKPNISDIPTLPDNTNSPGKKEGLEHLGNQGSRRDRVVAVTGDMLKISEYVCLMLIVLYRIYVSRRDIDTVRCVDNIAISMKDVEENGCKETLMEEKKDEK